MAQFVINEWLWADSSGANGQAAQSVVLDFLDRLARSDHRIVVIEGSMFDTKAWALCKMRDTIAVEIVKIYIGRVRQNLDRCLLLDFNQVAALPDHLATAIKDDDHYLLRAQRTVGDAAIVTTDEPLRTVLAEHGIPCLSREGFLAAYFP
ncbi:MAG: hypothetical protein HY047_04720 [Acidobacteria bacterium]|nr:hypothetical protein [Acidobacteriota bacterium]